jgi:hypothetical protein
VTVSVGYETIRAEGEQGVARAAVTDERSQDGESEEAQQ